MLISDNKLYRIFVVWVLTSVDRLKPKLHALYTISDSNFTNYFTCCITILH